MAQESDLKFCMVWETEQPFIGRDRQSSCFRMFGDEWYLQLSIEPSETCGDLYVCFVYLHERNGVKTLETSVTPNCLIIADRLVLSGINQTVAKSGDWAMYCYPQITDLTPSEHTSTWKIFCSLSCPKYPSLQINNETIHLSTVKAADPTPRSVDRSVQVSTEIPPDIETLCSDFSTLLQDEIFPDFQLKCGDRNFPVHRSVLSARSEVFRAMFRSRMLESESGTADITDLEAPVLDLLLKFVYSGKLEQVSEGSISKIYEAADKYAIHSLKRSCSFWMKGNTTEENCVGFLDLADSHTDHDLRASVVSFIVRHPGVLKSPAWMAYSRVHHELANDVLQTYVFSTIQ